jgi:hypothetical protein
VNARSLRPHRAAAALASFAIVATVGLVAAPAATAVDAFSVTVSPTTGLDPAGDTVAVTLNHLPADQGIYVRLCVQPQPGTRPASGTCDGQGVWAVENYPYGPAPTDGSVVKPSAGAVTLPVRAAFASIDCTATPCGVFTRRDHPGGATDLSLDTFTPLSFAVETPEEPSPEEPTETTPFSVSVAPTAGVAAGDAVAVTVAGVPSDQGVYVRWCAAPEAGSTRPSAERCNGQGVWALEQYPYGPRPTDGTVADPTAGPIDLPTTATIGTIDCRTSVCGVATRRDHRDGADTSMDTFTAVTLTTTTGPDDGTESGTDEGGTDEGTDDGTENGSGSTDNAGTATLSTTSAAIGSRVTVSGSGFNAGEAIDGALFSDPIDVGTTTASATGSAALAFTVPEVEQGRHTVQLKGRESGRIVTATLTVTAAATATPSGATTEVPATGAASSLPTTGADAAGLVPMSVALLLAGTMLATAARLVARRQQADVR